MRGTLGTKRQQKRKDALRAIGCVACILDGQPEGNRFEDRVRIHHMLSGNKKIGEDATIPLCDPHHVGEPCSWHAHRAEFRRRYGSDQAIVEYANSLLPERFR